MKKALALLLVLVMVLGLAACGDKEEKIENPNLIKIGDYQALYTGAYITKDYDGDRFVDLTGQVTEVYLKEGDKNLYLSDDGGKTLFQERKMTMAGITAMNQIQYFLTPATRISSLDQVQVTVDGEPLFFGTGNSYFAICPLGSPLSYE